MDFVLVFHSSIMVPDLTDNPGTYPLHSFTVKKYGSVS